MALHDNPLWILSHIQNSFVVSDSTGNSELVLTNDTKQYLPVLAKSHDVSVYLDKELELPNSDDEDNEDQLSTSIGNYQDIFSPLISSADSCSFFFSISLSIYLSAIFPFTCNLM